jgi:hypothetical protein
MEAVHEINFPSFKTLFLPLTTFTAIHIIILVGLLVYGNTLFNGFVWDDTTFILLDPMMHSLSNFFTLFNANHINAAGQYRPIPAIYFTTLYSLFQKSAFFYHFAQLVCPYT